MAYKSRFTGAKIDELLEIVQNQQTNPGLVIENVDCQGGGGKEGV